MNETEVEDGYLAAWRALTDAELEALYADHAAEGSES